MLKHKITLRSFQLLSQNYATKWLVRKYVNFGTFECHFDDKSHYGIINQSQEISSRSVFTIITLVIIVFIFQIDSYTDWAALNHAILSDSHQKPGIARVGITRKSLELRWSSEERCVATVFSLLFLFALYYVHHVYVLSFWDAVISNVRRLEWQWF